jgi:hypothetical protein
MLSRMSLFHSFVCDALFLSMHSYPINHLSADGAGHVNKKLMVDGALTDHGPYLYI